MNLVLEGLFAKIKLDLKNKIKVTNNNLIIKLENGNEIQISSNKIA